MVKNLQRLYFKRESEVAFNWTIQQQIKKRTERIESFKSSEDSTLVLGDGSTELN